MNIPKLHAFKTVAKELGVPVDSLKNVADQYGFTIRIGSATRISEDDIPELLKKCRVSASQQGSTGETGPTVQVSGKSEPKAGVSARALQIAKELRENSSISSRPRKGHFGQ